MRTAVRLLTFAALAAALPAWSEWEELRKNDSTWLSIDPGSIRKRGDEVAFKYLVDFRQTQGDFKTAQYRSLTVKAAIRCKPRMIALRETEVFAGNEGKGPAAGVMKPTREESRFKKIEEGTSDEELFQRVCGRPAPQPRK